MFSFRTSKPEALEFQREEIRRYQEENTEYSLNDLGEKILSLVRIINHLIDTLKVRQIQEPLEVLTTSRSKSVLPTAEDLQRDFKADRGVIFALKSLMEVLDALLKNSSETQLWKFRTPSLQETKEALLNTQIPKTEFEE